MKEPITISPMGLYYLGTQMKAKYIDYAYLAAMPDIQKRYQLHRQEALEQLEQAGYLEEDFSGEIEIAQTVIDALTPVFFGKIESRIIGKNRYNLHIMDEKITAAVAIPDTDGRTTMISFYEITEEDIPFFLKKAGSEEISIQCADVEKGYRDGIYTAQQLKQKERLKEAIGLIKGV